MAVTWYSERKKVNEGQAVAPVYHTSSDRDAMERQFHLNCANVLDSNNPRNDLDVCEWGTIENGALERKRYTKPVEPEPGEEPVEEEP